MSPNSKQFTIQLQNNNNQQIVLSNDEIVKLELKLNLSPWSREYIEIGNNLYDFHVGKPVSNNIEVSSEQFRNLKLLSEKSYEEYKIEIYNKRN
jgi:hypothetical protein